MTRLRLIHSAVRRATRPEAVPGARPPFTSLIDAKAAARLLGVPHTWLLAQARAQSIPHHRLGHYVRFDPEDLHEWLQETKIQPGASTVNRGPRRGPR